MAGVWKAIRLSKQVQLQMGQINFSLSDKRKAHGASMFIDDSNMKVHSIQNKSYIEPVAHTG